MERVKGIEPSYAAWKAAVLPLNYTRMKGSYTMAFASRKQVKGIDSGHLALPLQAASPSNFSY